MLSVLKKLAAAGLAGLVLLVLAGVVPGAEAAAPGQVFSPTPEAGIRTPTSGNQVTPYDLIRAINSQRMSHGLPALKQSNILMGTAQYTAEVMAGGRLGGHIGDVKGRVQAAGYGVGDIVWATENFITGPLSLSGILQGWSDALHMKPILDPNYCHIGAGVAEADGTVYYIVHAAYTSNKKCKDYPKTAVGPGTPEPTVDASFLMAEVIIPVAVATPRPDGKTVHVVQAGQSLWSIAIAYNSRIVDIVNWNGITADKPVVWIGQKLVIPPRPTAKPTLTLSGGTATIGMAAMVEATGTATPAGRVFLVMTPTPSPQPRVVPLERKVGIGVGAAAGLGLLLILYGVLTRR